MVDQVLAAADHHVAVRLERLLERRGVVALDPVDDGRLVDARVDLAGGLDHGPRFCRELLLADREDRVGVEAVERPERRRARRSARCRAPTRRRRRRASPRATRHSSPIARRAVSAAEVRRRRSASGRSVPAATISSRNEGRSPADLDLEPLPQPDLGDRRPRLRALEVVGDRLEPAGEQREPLRKRGEVLGEDQEQGVADRVERGRALLPGPDGLGVEDRPPQVVDLEVALEPGQRREARRLDRLDRREVGLLVGQLAEQRRRGRRRRGGRPRCGCRRTSRAPGCRGRAAGSASRRGRRGARPADPGGLALGRVRTTSSSRSVTIPPCPRAASRRAPRPRWSPGPSRLRRPGAPPRGRRRCRPGRRSSPRGLPGPRRRSARDRSLRCRCGSPPGPGHGHIRPSGRSVP